LLSAAAHRQTVLMPRYGFLLVALTGDEENRPEVCQGIFQVPTPFSIAAMIWDVTFAYTSGFVFSFVDIEADPQLWCLGTTSDAHLVRSRLCVWRSIPFTNRTSGLNSSYTSALR